MSRLSHHFASRNTGVAKAALEVFVQLHRKRALDLSWLLADTSATDALVQLLAHADVDIQQRALSLLNVVVTSDKSGGDDDENDPYARLAASGAFEHLRKLRHSRDVMVRTQLCAFQVRRG